MAKRNQVSTAAAPTPSEVAQVKAWFIEGHPTERVGELIAENFPLADQLQLLQAVGDDLRKDAAVDRDAVRGFAINAFREIYRQAMEAGDFAAAIRAVKLLTEV